MVAQMIERDAKEVMPLDRGVVELESTRAVGDDALPHLFLAVAHRPIRVEDGLTRLKADRL